MRKILNLTVILGFLITGIYSCGKKSETKEIQDKKLQLVKSKEVKGENYNESYKVIGVVKPYTSTKLSSEEGGLITYLKKDKGQRVGKGEVVVRLKKDVDEAAYEQAIAGYNLAKENFDRTEKLFNEKVAPEQQFTNAKLQLDIAMKSVELYERRLSKGEIVSPINGVVDAKLMNLGEMTGPGVPILSIVDISRVKITAGIPERYTGQISKGQSVKITFDVLPGETYEGRISYISPTLDAQSRAFEIEILLNNYASKFKPEMSAAIVIDRLSLDNAIVLMQDMIIDNGDEKFIFVLEGDIAKKRVIKIGGFSDNKVLIESGLRAGDKLIYEGFRGLNDGEKVNVVN